MAACGTRKIRDGLIQWVICPECQTPEQNLEAMIKEAMLDYYHDADGRHQGTRQALARPLKKPLALPA
jgi:hypothetical protein